MNSSGDKVIRQQVGNMQVSFDKEAAWLRLQEKMESRDEKKGYFRLGWVAAIVVVATVLWFGIGDSKNETVVKKANKITAPVANEAPIVHQAPEQMIQVTTPPTVPTTQKREKKSIVKLTPNKVLPEEQESAMPVIVKEEAVTLQEDAPVVTVAPKPKMRTVHINEIAEQNRIEQRMLKSRYAGNKKSFFSKPAIEREDAERGSFGLFDPKKTIAN